MYNVCVLSHSVLSDSLWPHGLYTPKLLCPWNSPGKNTRVGSHSLLWRIFPTQGSNTHLLHCRQILCHLSHQGSQGVLSHIEKIHLESLTFHRKVRENYFQPAFQVCMLKWLGIIERAGLISVLGTVPEGDVWASNSLLCSLTFLRGWQDSRRKDILLRVLVSSSWIWH